MEIPLPDPAKLLQSWMEWERGEVTPGRVMANLKTGGIRDLLEGLAKPAPKGAGKAPKAAHASTSGAVTAPVPPEPSAPKGGPLAGPDKLGLADGPGTLGAPSTEDGPIVADGPGAADDAGTWAPVV
jgi:hypothetical protein